MDERDRTWADDLSFTVRWSCDASAPVTVTGELDLATGAVLSEVAEVLLSARRQLVLELSAVSFADSHGVTGLAELFASASRRGCVVRVENPSPALRRVVGLLLEHDLARPSHLAPLLASEVGAGA